LPNALEQGRCLWFREFVSGSSRVRAGEKHRLRCVDVPNAAYMRLIKQHLFQTAFRALKCRTKILIREIVRQRFRRKFADLLRLMQPRCVNDLHQTEMTLILKHETS